MYRLISLPALADMSALGHAAVIMPTSVTGRGTYNNSDTLIADGEVGWGMHTISSDAGDSEYVPSTRFAQTRARHVRIYATGGDSFYAIGESQCSANRAGDNNVPPPASLPLLLIGLGASRFASRRNIPAT